MSAALLDKILPRGQMFLRDSLRRFQFYLEQQIEPIHLDGSQARSVCHQKCDFSLAEKREDLA